MTREEYKKEIANFKTRIYCRIGNDNVFVTTTRNRTDAENLIKYYEMRDRYEIEVEKYKMPISWGGKYPEYFILK